MFNYFLILADLTSGKVFVRITESFRNKASNNKMFNSNESTILKCTILDAFPLRYCGIHSNATIEENSQKNIVIESGLPSEQIDVLEIFGVLHRLSSVFCETFPNLMGLDGSRLELKYIDENAFHKCTKLRKLNLINNKLSYISPIVFEKSNKLQILNLQYNQIEITNHLKYLPNLQALSIENKESFHFNIDYVPIMEYLRHLDLRGVLIKGVHDKNRITTDGNAYSIPPIDEKKFLEKFPNLKELILAESGTESAELHRLKDFFIKHGVECCTSNMHFSGGI